MEKVGNKKTLNAIKDETTEINKKDDFWWPELELNQRPWA